MRALTRFVFGSLAALAIAAVGAQEPNARLAANLSTPAPSKCATPLDGGTSVATPESIAATPSPVAEFADKESLIRALEARGVTVDEAGTFEQEFFNAERISRLILSGGPLSERAELQVYEYADVQTLAEDVSQVTPDGNLETVMITWIADPHFFCAGQLMVIYLGDDSVAHNLLTELLGPQFAGR